MAADVTAVRREPRTNPLAVAALVAAVAGIVVGIPLGLARPLLGGVVVVLGWALALAFGYSAREQIRMSGGGETGDQLARTAIAVGLVELGAGVLAVLVVIMISSPVVGLFVTALTVGLLL